MADQEIDMETAPAATSIDAAVAVRRRRGKAEVPKHLLCVATLALSLGGWGCASKPLIPYSADTAPLVLLPIGDAGIQDKRGRFREIYCTVLKEHGHDLPDYRPCDEALTRVGAEPSGSGLPVPLGASARSLVALVVGGI